MSNIEEYYDVVVVGAGHAGVKRLLHHQDSDSVQYVSR